jgi:DNA repair protein RadC
MNTPYTIKFRLETFTVHDNGKPDGGSMRAGVPLRGSEEVARFARPIYETLDADKEHFVVLTLNNKNKLTGFKVISTGSLTSSLVHPREVFTAVLELRAAAIVFLHNHPSGDPMPSPEDIEITKRLKECSDLLGIRCLDHVILGTDRFFSFSDKGML